MTPQTATPFLKVTRSYFEGATKIDGLFIAVERSATKEEIKDIKKYIDDSLIINRIQPMGYHPFVHLVNGGEDAARCLLFCASKITENGRNIYNVSNEGGQFIITQNRSINPDEWELVVRGPATEAKADAKADNKEEKVDAKADVKTEKPETKTDVKIEASTGEIKVETKETAKPEAPKVDAKKADKKVDAKKEPAKDEKKK